MKEAWRKVVMGISAQCQPTDLEAMASGFIPGHLTLVHTAESWKEKEGLVGGIILLQGGEDTYIIVANMLAVLQVNETLLSDIWREYLL